MKQGIKCVFNISEEARYKMCVFSRIFQRKISANRLAGGRAASTIRVKFWLKFCFLTITQMVLNVID